MDPKTLSLLPQLSTAIGKVEAVLAPLEDNTYGEVGAQIEAIEAAKLNVSRNNIIYRYRYLYIERQR